MPNHIALLGDKLPQDVKVHAYHADEGISRPYAVTVEFSTEDKSFAVDDCLQHRLLLEVIDPQGHVRYFDGLPDQVGFVAHRGASFFFRVRLRPAMAALEHREGSRIFQDKSPVDVVKAILADAGVDKTVEWRVRQTYAPREFLCQYREREIDFVNRILEEEGIFYFFLHTESGHTLVFADDPAAFQPASNKTPILSARQGVEAGTRPLHGFRRTKWVRPVEICLRDYDFEQPAVLPTAVVPAPGNVPVRQFVYPGGFKTDAEGSRKAGRRLSSLRADMDVCTGTSATTGLACGTPMSVEGANEPFLNGDFIVTQLVSKGSGDGAAIANEFQAIPKGASFAVPCRTPKPHIHGIQTAVVTGPTNTPEAIHVDKFGRIKVRFLWDRSGKADDKASCWLRVSQVNMGGSMILPRVGWEVSVAFLDGDPDRPIVLGRTYNAENVPPYGLPGAAADGSLKSMSTPGGAGHNEIKMADTAGKQGMSMSAQKDLNVSTGNDKNETIAVNEDTSVGNNYNLTVGSNESLTVGANQSIDVGNALQVKVSGAQSVTVGGSETDTAKADYVEKVGGARSYTVGGSQITISCGVRQEITGAFTRHVGALQANISLGSISDTNLATFDEKAGAAIVHAVNGVSAESVTGDKNQVSYVGELHWVKALSMATHGCKQLVGGVHIRKVGADFVVSGENIVVGGGVGKFNAGGSSIVLNGGPVTLTGSKIAIETLALVKLSGNLKIGG